MTARGWLADTSALARLDRPEVVEVLIPRVASGRVYISIVTELEIGYSARSASHYWTVRHSIVDHLLPCPIPSGAEGRARTVQQDLVARGRHRSAGVADLLLAAIAEVEGLTVLHYDADFDMIAQITNQPMEWVVPRGSI